MNHQQAPSFHVISGAVVNEILKSNADKLVDLIAETYRAHEAGQSINPDSYFLQFPNEPKNRIIALPASLETDDGASGIKWVASFPKNISNNLPRASAVQILNSLETGYPYAILESAIISAVRTAASAVLGANLIFKNTGRNRKCETISFIGGGVIGRTIADQFMVNGWSFSKAIAYDINEESSHLLSNHISGSYALDAEVITDIKPALEADIVVFATNAGAPYVVEEGSFHGGQTVLNISLRDLAPNVILNAQNLFDDIEHCLKANTSPHLAEQMVGNRDFATGTVAKLARGEIALTMDNPTIYSPFGMGILDIALSQYVYKEAIKSGRAIEIPHFFGELSRW